MLSACPHPSPRMLPSVLAPLTVSVHFKSKARPWSVRTQSVIVCVPCACEVNLRDLQATYKVTSKLSVFGCGFPSKDFSSLGK